MTNTRTARVAKKSTSVLTLREETGAVLRTGRQDLTLARKKLKMKASEQTSDEKRKEVTK